MMAWSEIMDILEMKISVTLKRDSLVDINDHLRPKKYCNNRRISQKL